ncbi:MAG: cell envelope integrity protein CreD [Pseudomonadota bacterium]
MNPPLTALKNSVSTKAVIIATLTLALLIPVAMVNSTIHDRQSTAREAEASIMQSWGGRQAIGGPILVIPYELNRVTGNGPVTVVTGQLHLLPQTLDVDVSMRTEVRHRGLYQVPVYTAKTAMTARFAPPDTSGLGIADARMLWKNAYVALSITDPRAARRAPTLTLDKQETRFGSGGSRISNLPSQLVASIDRFIEPKNRTQAIDLRIDFDVSGTRQFDIQALGDETTVSMNADWADPSFNGAYLPESYTLSDEGFTAEWRATGLGRALPARWLDGDLQGTPGFQSMLGVELFETVSLYTLTDRATKYGILFIGLTFVAYFLFEVLGGLRVHPLQYLLVGFANAMFYLLLLSFAEHVGFGEAYLLSALASVGMIAGYSHVVLRSRSKAMIMIGILSALYVFLYMTLNAETYALLAGSIGLWVVLAAIMYLTRRIDWYAVGKPANGQKEMAL